MGRVLRISASAWSRYFSSNTGLCSVKFWSDCGRPASTSATFRPASESLFAAQPPEAPEPTTITSKLSLVFSPTIGLPERLLYHHRASCRGDWQIAPVEEREALEDDR